MSNNTASWIDSNGVIHIDLRSYTRVCLPVVSGRTPIEALLAAADYVDGDVIEAINNDWDWYVSQDEIDRLIRNSW